MARVYSREIANEIAKFLRENEWNFSFDEEKGFFKFGLNLKSRLKSIVYRVDIFEDDFVVNAVAKIGADTNDEIIMHEMEEFVCRANYGLKNGNFTFDPDDGEIGCKTYVDCEGALPAQAVIKNSIYFPASLCERYGNGIVEVIFGISDAKTAIEKAER